MTVLRIYDCDLHCLGSTCGGRVHVVWGAHHVLSSQLSGKDFLSINLPSESGDKATRMEELPTSRVGTPVSAESRASMQRSALPLSIRYLRFVKDSVCFYSLDCSIDTPYSYCCGQTPLHLLHHNETTDPYPPPCFILLTDNQTRNCNPKKLHLILILNSNYNCRVDWFVHTIASQTKNT